ncbi:unnamed protein product [Clonostachys rhizophaga]|uniref:Gamma interferon inducible lysosomal thiol reductase GILT n=1 Tax=Clonostachys rhizophaga TaxID=160324 RepID=A0A9N9YA33_9HYPO|nr:unnamed protein product [Clonostachys rhizophaga]
MDEKAPYVYNTPAVNSPIMAASRASVRAVVALFILFTVTFYSWRSWTLSSPLSLQLQPSPPTPESSPVDQKTLVPLEAHIISKCPDTRDALRELILPAMMRVHDKVDFRLSYIGTPTANDGVQCKHGPSECMGNIIELCASELYPDPKISLGFVMCLTKDYKHIPDRSLIEDCALEHAIDFQQLNECATRDDGAHGIQLLRSSIERTAEAGVTISCTIRLNNETYCIRDGGEWIDCPHGAGVNDLVIAIEKLYHSS